MSPTHSNAPCPVCQGIPGTGDSRALHERSRCDESRPRAVATTLLDHRPGLCRPRGLRARARPPGRARISVLWRSTCVDLDRQLLWAQTGEDVVFDPVPVRTGRDSEETRPGWHEIYWRSRDHVSTIYDDAPMPYARFFDEGQALHGRLDDLYDGGGSAGCVNLRLGDAQRLWDLLDVGDQVYIWGTKPGTGG
ncbi:L,D-transpeptidase [Streptomyces sp. NPDC004609]|uniref:L,D-transpeptidase n=1 Tax=Streptomyces sp. NPDC004609 TaxID=3364704 RepID=UPI00368096D7